MFTNYLLMFQIFRTFSKRACNRKDYMRAFKLVKPLSFLLSLSNLSKLHLMPVYAHIYSLWSSVWKVYLLIVNVTCARVYRGKNARKYASASFLSLSLLSLSTRSAINAVVHIVTTRRKIIIQFVRGEAGMDAGRSMKSSHLRLDRTFNHHKFREKPQTGFPPQYENGPRYKYRSHLRGSRDSRKPLDVEIRMLHNKRSPTLAYYVYVY